MFNLKKPTINLFVRYDDCGFHRRRGHKLGATDRPATKKGPQF